MHPSVVALDVNPGGDFWSDGHFGVAEIVADEITANFELSFVHPAVPGDDGDVGSVEEFRTAWSFLESFIAGRLVVAYNAPFDMNAIARMLVRAGVEPPEMSFVCVYEMRRKLLAGGGRATLWSTVFDLGLESRERMAPLFPVNTGVRIPAGHDARACALLLTYLARERGVSPGELVASWRARRLASARVFTRA